MLNIFKNILIFIANSKMSDPVGDSPSPSLEKSDKKTAAEGEAPPEEAASMSPSRKEVDSFLLSDCSKKALFQMGFSVSDFVNAFGVLSATFFPFVLFPPAYPCILFLSGEHSVSCSCINRAATIQFIASTLVNRRKSKNV